MRWPNCKTVLVSRSSERSSRVVSRPAVKVYKVAKKFCAIKTFKKYCGRVFNRISPIVLVLNVPTFVLYIEIHGFYPINRGCFL